MLIRKKHLNLLGAIAWSYHRTTGIDFKELFAQASLVYCEAVLSYNPKKGTLSKYISIRVNRSLIWFGRKEMNNRFKVLEESWAKDLYYTNPTPWFEIYESMNQDCQTIANMILSDPHRFLSMPPKMARGKVVEELRNNRKWKWVRIWRSVAEIKSALNKTE